MLGIALYLDRKIDNVRKELKEDIRSLADKVERLQQDVWMIKGFLFRERAFIEEDKKE